MADGVVTKPFKNSTGTVVRHGRMVQHWSTDQHRNCEEPLEFRGYPDFRDDGTPIVDWIGDFHHREVFCPVHGPVTSVSTEYRAKRDEEPVAPREDAITEF